MGKSNRGKKRKSDEKRKEEKADSTKHDAEKDENEQVGEQEEEQAEEREVEEQEVQEEQEEQEPADTVERMISDGKYRNKQRCLTICSRGVTARYRHLMEDLRTLIPHHKKESKLDPGKDGMGRAVNDIAAMRSCNTFLFLECRKHQDAYLWLGKIGDPNGPSARFHVTNIHTMDELRLTGNCMKGSRPILTFDESFGRLAHLKLLKELFIDIFGTPRGHPASKPFVDRVMAFYYADNKIWVRNYQILEEQPENALEAHMLKKQKSGEDGTSLVEIGPRFVLNPIRIFRGSFGGQTLFQNPDFVSPNEFRALQQKRKGRAYVERKESQKKRKERESELVVPEDPLDSVFR